MDTADVPTALRERLGDSGTAGLVELLDNTKREWSAHVMAIVGERFERRLVEETSGLRVEMAQGFASVRVEMAEGFAAVCQEMAQQRVELLKWAFVFWMGQFVAMVGLFALSIRLPATRRVRLTDPLRLTSGSKGLPDGCHDLLPRMMAGGQLAPVASARARGAPASARSASRNPRLPAMTRVICGPVTACYTCEHRGSGR